MLSLPPRFPPDVLSLPAPFPSRRDRYGTLNASITHVRPVVKATEFKILLLLAERPQAVFSRLQIVNAVQGYDFAGFERVIDAHIKNIRHKIEDDPQRPAFLKTVYGAGYKFIGTPDRDDAA